MKNSIKITLIILSFSFCAFSQHLDHDDLEILFKSKSLAVFENDLGLMLDDFKNQHLFELMENQYHHFQMNIKSRLNSGEEILAVEFEVEYQKLVNETKEKIIDLPISQQIPQLPPTKIIDGPCVNMDFEEGNLNGWTLTRGDVDGSVPYSFVAEIPVGVTAYHQIFSGGNDPITGIPTVNPLGGNYSVRLGNGSVNGAKAARMRQTFFVDTTNSVYEYSYAVVFESPSDINHTLNQKPYFVIRFYDELGNSIPCGEYSVIADLTSVNSYSSIQVGVETILYKNWETVFTDLSAYIGQNVTIEFTTGDCSLSGHYGYAYIDASCSASQITASNNLICRGENSVLTAPSVAASYLWSTGETTQTITVTSAGNYSCTLTPIYGSGCDLVIDIDINSSDSLSPIANFSSSKLFACINETIDFIDLSTMAAPGAISKYKWNFGDGIVTPLSNGLIGGVQNTTGAYNSPSHAFTTSGIKNVQLFIESTDGCPDNITIPITIQPLPNVNAGVDKTVCDGTAVTLNGTGAIGYVWNNGVVNGVPFVQGVGTIIYTVIGTDTNGCQNTDQVNIKVNPLPVIYAGADQQHCEDIYTIYALLLGYGGVGYVWDNGVVNGQYFALSPGTVTYTVIGTDANGCQNTDQVNITLHPMPNVSAGFQEVCIGEAVTFNAIGASTYEWEDPGITNGNSIVFPASLIGTYTMGVVGTDIYGCQNSDQFTFTINPLPNVNAGVDKTVCYGTAVTLNGAGAIGYVWSNGVVNGVPFVQEVGTIIYTVTGTDTNGCQNTDQVAIKVNPLPIVSAGLDQEVCEGEMIILNAVGGSSYVWDHGVVNNNPFSQTVGTTTYTVIGTDLNGCQNTDQVDVTVNPLPNVNGGLDQIACEGAMLSLNGSGANNYIWDNDVLDSVSFLQDIGTIMYTVIGTDLNGCENIDQVTITINEMIIVDAGIDQIVCEGTMITLNGAGADNYVWDNGVIDAVAFNQSVGTVTYTVVGTNTNGCENIDQIDVTVNPLPIVNAGLDQEVCEGIAVTLNGAGTLNYTWDNGIMDGISFMQLPGTVTYTVIGIDANGCENSDQVDIIVNPLPIVSAGLDQEVCEGVTVTLTGAGADSYVWDNSISDGVFFNQVVGLTTYTVIGTDANGCENTDQVDVMVNPLPFVDGGLDQEVCEGVAVTVIGTGAVIYTWDNGVIDGVSFIQSPGTVTYTVIGIDTNGCENTAQVDVIVNPLPIVSAGVDQEVCEGVAVTLFGTGTLNYTWNNGIMDGVTFIQSPGTIIYTVIGVDTNGCQNSDQVDIMVNPLPIVSAGVDQEVCEGVVVTLIGTGAVNYTWNNGIFDGLPFHQTVGLTTYTVIGTDANGCENKDSVDIIVNPLPNVNAGLDQEVCEGVTVTLSGSGTVNYIWNNGVINGVPFVQSPATITYTVIGTDLNGCENKDSVDVIVNPLPIVSAGLDQEICENVAVILNGTGTLNYIWNNGVIDGVPFIQSPGTIIYTVVGTDTNGCQNSDEVEVLIHQRPVVSTQDVEVCEGEAVLLYGQGADYYVWTGGINDNEIFYPTTSGNYTVTGYYNNGCSSQADAIVTVHLLPNADFSILNSSISTVNSTTGFFNLSSGAVSYEWNFGDGNPVNTEFEPTHTFPSESPGEYSIILTAYSDFGCTSEIIKIITTTRDYTIYVPNTFTPDGDQYNNLFLPHIDGLDLSTYKMGIYNRWGNLVFETNDIKYGWDGTYLNSGIVQNGTYTWKITIKSIDTGEIYNFVGHVNVLK